MAFRLLGPHEWSMTRDELGHREYKITHLVWGSVDDGPAQALLTPGLPLVGSVWRFSNDIDLWAFCHANATVKAHYKAGKPGRYFLVEQTFSTKNKRRCVEQKIEDPLLEPPDISGSFTKTKEEAVVNAFGFPIINSAHEQVRGPEVEFEKSQPTVKIKQNVASFYQAFVLPNRYLNTVNAYPLWGLVPRMIKLGNFSWDKKYYGQCYPYYTRTLEFEINYQTWDRLLLDEGTKVLNGRWTAAGDWELRDIDGRPPNRFNPKHFIHFTDRRGKNIRGVLNGFGVPAGVSIGVTQKYAYIHTEAATGKNLWDTKYWLPTNSIVPTVYNDLTQYAIGSIVTHLGDTYIAYVETIQDAPPSADSWYILPGAGVIDRGVWASTTSYSLGDAATNSLPVTGIGRILLQKHLESDFSLLGIPLGF